MGPGFPAVLASDDEIQIPYGSEAYLAAIGSLGGDQMAAQRLSPSSRYWERVLIVAVAARDCLPWDERAFVQPYEVDLGDIDCDPVSWGAQVPAGLGNCQRECLARH